MAADLATTPTTGIRVQACGDCHLSNFGGFATPERNIIFDLNDFDETLPAPWEWDVKRLAASFVLAARSNGLPDKAGRRAAVATVRSYRKWLNAYSEMNPLELWSARIHAEEFLKMVPPRFRKAAARRIAKAGAQRGSDLDYPKLTSKVGGQVGITDSPPFIFHPQELEAQELRDRIENGLAAYRETLPADRQPLLDTYRLIDAAIKVVGVGSVGRRCWIALMMSANGNPLFLQFKEAVGSVLEPYAGKSIYEHPGERVVVGQRSMQSASDIFLGWASGKAGFQFYIRQLRDAKISARLEIFDGEYFAVYGQACGRVLARAHAKTGDACMISGYLGTSDAFDEALGDFAVAYADQAERDHEHLKADVRAGKIEVYEGADS
jgi:uncharacterized protein (DUF2252 family)